MSKSHAVFEEPCRVYHGQSHRELTGHRKRSNFQLVFSIVPGELGDLREKKFFLGVVFQDKKKKGECGGLIGRIWHHLGDRPPGTVVKDCLG